MRLLIFLFALLAVNAAGYADTLYVPKEYGTVQQAIDAALDGDLVLVAPGTYLENVDYLGKNISVRSDGDGDPGTYDLAPDITVLDGNQSRSVVTFESEEGIWATLNGFTITNGRSRPEMKYEGGGITCVNSSAPVVSQNIIRNNYSHYHGGGVSCSSKSHPTLYGNQIFNNKAAYGGGVSCTDSSTAVINHNDIYDNAAFYDNTKWESGAGGGIYCDYPAYPTIVNNQINSNWGETLGGGIFCISEAEIEGNKIMDNYSHTGGGIYCRDDSHLIDSILIERNIIQGNSCHDFGGGIWGLGPDLAIRNNFIYKNSSANMGGGIYCYSKEEICEFTSNTVVGNSADRGGGLACQYWTTLSVTNTIFWDNKGNVGKEIFLEAKYGTPLHLTLSYCDLEGGKSSVYTDFNSFLHWGPGMIDRDPLFLGSTDQHDLHLTWLSPCINMGKNEYAPGIDIDMDTRPIMGTADIGADEFEGVHALEADAFLIKEAKGGAVQFKLDGSMHNAGRDYILLGSLSGKVPGIPLQGWGQVLPINWDFFTMLVASHPNSPVFRDFYGTLDPSGQMTAVFDTLGPIPGTLGITMNFAYFLLGPHWDFVSNPIDVEIVM